MDQEEFAVNKDNQTLIVAAWGFGVVLTAMKMHR